MSTAYPEIFAALAAPFHASDVKRSQHIKGEYITARTAANRLDDVLGPENWQCEPLPWREHAVKYRLTITLPGGETVTKYAIGSNTAMSAKQSGKCDPGEDDKGGDSDGLKRAAALFGVGRYLYGDGALDYGQQAPANATPQKAPDVPQDARTRAERLVDWCTREGHTQRLLALSGANYQCAPVALTDEQADALYKILKAARPVTPNGTQKPPSQPPAQARPQGGKNENGNPIDFGWPRSGAALYAWCKNLQDSFKTNLINPVNEAFCNETMGYSRTWKEWTPEQVEQAAVHVARLVKTFPGYDGQFDGKVPDLEQIKEKLWQKTADLLVNLGEQQPTQDAINASIAMHSEPFAAKYRGEVLNNLEFCDNAALMVDVLKSIEDDLADSMGGF